MSEQAERAREDGWRCVVCEALTPYPARFCEECEPPLRHASGGRLLTEAEIQEAEGRRGERL